jgi:hypothetical protein
MFSMAFRQSLLQIPLVFVLFSLVTACTEPQVRPATPNGAPVSQVFPEDFDRVWRASQLALSAYPIRVNDADSGTLETDAVKGDTIWTPPNATKRLPGSLKYKILVNLVRGKKKDEDSKAVRVTILKRIEHQKDFFAPIERIQTDGYEETAIMYRIERELNIDRLLAKARQKAGN